MWGVSLTQPTLTLLLCGEFLLHIPCCLHFYVGSFSYTSRDVLIFMEGVSLTHRVLASFFSFWGVSLFFFFFFLLLFLRSMCMLQGGGGGGNPVLEEKQYLQKNNIYTAE